MAPPRQDLRDMLYQALAEPVGLLLSSPDPAKARQLLYANRTAIGDPELGRLQFRLVDLGEGPQIAIVKGASLPAAEPYQPLPGAASPNLGDLDL